MLAKPLHYLFEVAHRRRWIILILWVNAIFVRLANSVRSVEFSGDLLFMICHLKDVSIVIAAEMTMRKPFHQKSFGFVDCKCAILVHCICIPSVIHQFVPRRIVCQEAF